MNRGRKAAAGGNRVNFTVMVSPSTKEKIAALRKLGITIGRELDVLVDSLYRKHVEG